MISCGLVKAAADVAAAPAPAAGDLHSLGDDAMRLESDEMEELVLRLRFTALSSLI